MLNEIERKILKKMYGLDLWKSRHMRLENIIRSGFPSHELGKVKKAIHNLIKRGLIVVYSKSRKAIQLNHNKYLEIKEIIDENGNN